MRKIEAKVNNHQYERIIEYCEKNEISIYSLVKDCVLDKVGIKDRGQVDLFGSVIKSIKKNKKD